MFQVIVYLPPKRVCVNPTNQYPERGEETMKKLNMMIALLVIASVVLAACTPPATEAPTQAPAPTEAPTEAPTAAPTEPPVVEPTAADCPKAEVFCVGLVTDVGKINDKSFNQSAWEGVLQSQTDGVADIVQYIETTDAKDYAKNIGTFGDAGFDVIVTVGFALGEATVAAATTYPDVNFIGVDQFQAADRWRCGSELP
jgi:basic membrane protein A